MNTNDDRHVMFCGSRVFLDEGGKILDMNTGKRRKKSVLSVATSVAGYLLFSLVACGAPVSEKAPGLVPSVSAEGAAGGAASVGNALKQKEQQKDQSVAEYSGSIVGNSAGREAAQARLIPEAVAQSLDSPDARARLTALDHWNVTRGNAPLDPVFEAMEDEDEDVREKATAIVEQRWEEEQRKEKG